MSVLVRNGFEISNGLYHTRRTNLLGCPFQVPLLLEKSIRLSHCICYTILDTFAYISIYCMCDKPGDFRIFTDNHFDRRHQKNCNCSKHCEKSKLRSAERLCNFIWFHSTGKQLSFIEGEIVWFIKCADLFLD